MTRRFVRPLIATYRIQLTPTFGFDAVSAILADLVRIGISHVYLSPVAEAVTGSTHGYDVVDPATVRDELGGRAGLHRLARAAQALGLGIIVDIVPNHVSTAQPHRNPWWWSTLRDGRAGPAADWFDVDWDQADGRVIAPVLGLPLEDVIAAGELRIDGDELRYHELRFPLRTDDPVGKSPAAEQPVAAILARQRYRLQHWRGPDRNVRRFFTIDDLVAIRPEVPAVADAVHAIVTDLVAAGLLDGVRVDHVDGLADPFAYLHTLRAAVGDDRWIGVEKIVVGDEHLPATWPVDGTTGYEWIRAVDHLFTNPAGERVLTALWERTTGDALGYHDHEREGIRDVLAHELRPDLDRVAWTAAREIPGVGLDELRAAISAVTVELGRYRTYLVADAIDAGGAARADDGDRGDDVEVVRRAAAAAGRRGEPELRRALAALVTALLAGGETARRWQQLTGPALAKGGEDRALYRWFRLAAHNEVGGDPATWTLPVAAFHARNADVAERWPATLLTGSTHDTKRSEDVRARLVVLAEFGDRWVELVERWRPAIDDPATGPAAELLVLQTAAGAWPIDAGRLGDYLVKAARESGVRTSWTEADGEHEAALRRLATLLTEPPLANAIGRFVDEIDPAAQQVALAQLVLRCTAPGVPDVYQGGESWLHTLVDPDNRGDLDPKRLAQAADAAGASAGSAWVASDPKAAVLGRALAARRAAAAAFGPGSGYHPLAATGAYAEHVVAFVRSAPDPAASPTVVTVSSRFPASRPDGWLDTAIVLPAGPWRDVLDPTRAVPGGPTSLTELLGRRPAALLTAS